MAKLSTPYHACAVRYVDEHGVPTGHGCGNAAYRRHDGKWLCGPHTRQARARAARQAPAFEVIGRTRLT